MKRLGMQAAQTAVLLLLSTAAVQAGWGDRSPPGPEMPEGARPAAKADKDKGKDSDDSTFSVFGDAPKPKAKPKAAAADKDKKAAAEEKKEAPAKTVKTVNDSRPANVVDEAAAEREREMQALLRRQMVCLKLMRVAMDTGDDDLLKKAEALDERAREIYARRTAHLPGSRQANFDSDEGTLERHLGTTTRPTRGHSELLLKDRNTTTQAQAREDRP